MTRTAASGTTWRRRRQTAGVPGNRIPAIIVSPYAKKGTVDHTQYDTTSALRLITKRFQLPVLAGITARDQALGANGKPAMGDLTAVLSF